MTLKDTKTFVNTHQMKRIDVVPFYVSLILSNADDKEVKRVNDLILSKWKPSGLLYIKEIAWKRADAIRALEILKQAIIKHG